MTTAFKNFAFTLNNPTDPKVDILKGLIPKHCNYVAWAIETAPTTGTIHLQGFANGVSAKRLPGWIKVLPDGIHIERMRGTFKENEDYIKKVKNGDPQHVFQYGGLTEQEIDEQRNRKEEEKSKRRQLTTQFIEYAKKGRFDEIQELAPGRYLQSYRVFKEIHNDHQSVPVMQTISHFDFHWYYGATGTGKSRYAFTKYPNSYPKDLNKWWDGYKNGQPVIINEWYPECGLGQKLKNWADHYPFTAEFKGYSRAIRPVTIIITSNYSMEQCFSPDLLAPLKRRFKRWYFSELGKEPQLVEDGNQDTHFVIN